MSIKRQLTNLKINDLLVWDGEYWVNQPQTTLDHYHNASVITSGILDNSRISKSIHAGGVRTGITPPSNPIPGDIYYDTADEMLYSYDFTRGHWFGPLEWIDFGRNSTVSDGEILRSSFASVQPSTSTRGWVLPYDSTAIGIVCRTQGWWTGDMEITYNATGTGIKTIFSSAEQSQNLNIDYDIGTTESMGVMVNIISGSFSNPTARVYYKRRK